MNINLTPNQTPSEGSATKSAYKRLRELILTGDLAPGEKLKIDGLRDVLGTGASPIREALNLLVSDQLVVRHEQRGFRAAGTSRQDFDEILKLRCSLERMALRESIENATDEWIEELVVVHHRMTRLQAERSAEFEVQHKIFHMTLLSHATSPHLLRFCSQLYDLNIRYRYLAGRSSDYKGRKVDDEHRQILDAVMAKDMDLADTLLVSHYERTGAFLKNYID
jgi:GntR family carbon starvation induced transcriptional regulator